MMWGYGYGMGWMWVLSALVIVGIAVLVVLLVRNWSGRPSAVATLPTPRQILDERYARGELPPAEYRERVEGLSGKA